MPEELIAKVSENIESATQQNTAFGCPRCGFDTRQKSVHVDENLLKAYFKAALAQTPFSRTYVLFNGMLSATYEEPSGELVKLQEIAALHRTKEDTTTISDALDFAMLPTLTLVTTTSEEGDTKVLYKAGVERRKELLENEELPTELSQMPLIMLQALRNTYGEFSQLCAQLVNEAQDENFWKGAGRN